MTAAFGGESRASSLLAAYIVILAGAIPLSWIISASTGLPAAPSAIAATLRALPVVPRLLGAEGPVTYLVITQNSDEPRPTGGFMGAYALVTVAHFRVTDLRIANSRDFEDPTARRVVPPAPLERYADFGTHLMRDANWWPHLPTSMELMHDLWRRDQGSELSGAFMVTEDAVFRVIGAVGELYLPETGETIDRSNVRGWILEHLYPAGPDGQRVYQTDAKSEHFRVLAAALIRRLSAPDPAMVARLAAEIRALASERHISAWFPDPPVGRVADHLGVSSTLTRCDCEYLAVIDASVSYTKLGSYLSRSVLLEAGSSGARSLVIEYSNEYRATEARRSYPIEFLSRIFDPVTRRFVDREGSWAGWTRVYLTPGTRLSGYAGLDQPPEIGLESGRTTFGFYVDVPPGGRRRVTLEYVAPVTEEGPAPIAIDRRPGIPTHLTVRDADTGTLVDGPLLRDMRLSMVPR